MGEVGYVVCAYCIYLYACMNGHMYDLFICVCVYSDCDVIMLILLTYIMLFCCFIGLQLLSSFLGLVSSNLMITGTVGVGYLDYCSIIFGAD